MRRNLIKNMMFGFIMAASSLATSVQAEQTSLEIDYFSGGFYGRSFAIPVCADSSLTPAELKIFGKTSITRSLSLLDSATPTVNFSVAPTEAVTTIRIGGLETQASLAVQGFDVTLAVGDTHEEITAERHTSANPLAVISAEELQSLYSNSVTPRRRLAVRTNAPSAVSADSANNAQMILTSIALDLVFDLRCE